MSQIAKSGSSRSRVSLPPVVVLDHAVNCAQRLCRRANINTLPRNGTVDPPRAYFEG
jgi:hypothetical protein